MSHSTIFCIVFFCLIGQVVVCTLIIDVFLTYLLGLQKILPGSRTN